MQEYNKSKPEPAESNKSVEKPPTVEKVTKGTTQVKPKSGFQKMLDTFISDDASSIKSYLWDDVIVPGVKDLLDRSITGAIHALFYGDSRGRYYSRSGGYRDARGNVSNGYHQDYSRYYRDDGPTTVRRHRSGFEYNDLLFSDRADAEEVLDELRYRIDKYHLASVQDMFVAAGETCPHTYDRYGWTNIDGAYVVSAYGQWMIKLPPAMPIDD